MQEIGTEPAKNLLNQIGGWPVLEGDNWNDSNFTWYDQVYKMSAEGISKDYIVKLTIRSGRNASARSLFFDQPSLGIQREFFMKGLNDTNVQSYFTFMKDAAILLGADAER